MGGSVEETKIKLKTTYSDAMLKHRLPQKFDLLWKIVSKMQIILVKMRQTFCSIFFLTDLLTEI